jgi:hypothetical protein
MAAKDQLLTIHTEPPHEVEAKPGSPDENLLDALRGFVKQVSNQSQPHAIGKQISLLPASEEKKAEREVKFSFWHFVFILALAVDIALLYDFVLDLFPDIEQNSLMPRIAQLIPIVGGTLLVSYFDQIRKWILTLTAKKPVGLACLGLLSLMLLLQMHFYTLYVEVKPATAKLSIMEHEKFEEVEWKDSERHFLRIKKPLPYTLRVENETSEYQVTPMQVIQGTLARLTWFRGAPMRLELLHEVNVSSPQPNGFVEVQAPDTPAMRISKLTRSGSPIDPKAATAIYSWTSTFSDDNTPSLYLPAGKYLFALHVIGCQRSVPAEVPLKDGEQVDFLSACSGQ